MESLGENGTSRRNTEVNLIHGDLPENEDQGAEKEQTPSRLIYISAFIFFSCHSSKKQC